MFPNNYKSVKVPSSARRHIKYETFSSFVSVSRLRQVQNILFEETHSKVDGILCISGIDCRYNEGMSELLHFLLFGFFKVRKQELESSGFSEEVIDDLMLFIRRDRVEIYCNPINYHYLLPYTSYWPSVQYHCLPKQKYEEDEDKSEEFKILSLINMTSNCTCVGMPFNGKNQNSKFDIMAIERWPIIQAFALDDFGAGGFFTLKHEVVDMSHNVHMLQYFNDPVTVEIFLTEHMPLMEKQWDNMIRAVDMNISSSSAFLSHRQTAEPLISYFNHGMVGHKGMHGRLPFVAFTKDTEATKIRDICEGKPVNFSDIPLSKATGMEHMVCRIVSPQNPLMCTRTYFFCQQYWKHQDGQGDGHSDSNTFFNTRYAVVIYLAMVKAILDAIDVFTHSDEIEKTKECVISMLKKYTTDLKSKRLEAYFDSSNVEFKIEIPDPQGSYKEVVQGEKSNCLKHASLILYNVPALHPGQTASIGSLAFSESFLDSRILHCPDHRRQSWDDHLILTSTIPRIQVWSMPEPGNTKSKASNKSTYDIWGEQLVTHDDVDVCPAFSALLPPIKMTLTTWEKGLTTKNNRFGGFSLHKDHIRSIGLYDFDSMEEVSLLVVELEPSQDALASIPPHFCIPVDMDPENPLQIAFVFIPHSKGHTKLYGEILPAWKEDACLPGVERLTDIGYGLWDIQIYMQEKYKIATKNNPTRNEHSLKKMTSVIPDLSNFLEHLERSTRVIGQGLTQEMFDIYGDSAFLTSNSPIRDDNRIVVTIIGGAPGSEKNSLSSLITTYNSNVINWLVYKQPDECSVNATFLHRSMNIAIESQGQWEDQKKTRVILVAPGFCDTSDVIRILFAHPDRRISSHFRIGAITICIDPRNFYMENKMTLPMLKAQCAQGWVNNIVFTSETLNPSDLLDDVQSLVRTINSDVALLKAEKGEVKRSTDLDLIMSETAYQDLEKTKARLLLKPFWQEGHPHCLPCHPRMKDVVLKFTHPLEKHLLLIKLRGIRANYNSCPFSGNIYFVRGFVTFTSSPAVTEVQFTPLSGKLVINESKSSHDSSLSIISFTGVDLKENALKELLSSCVKQKPDKKKFLTREDISKHEMERLLTDHRHDELPEGWFYNGTLFVSMTGERSRIHPNIDGIVDVYLAKKNADIKKFNNNIDSETYVNLFP